MVQTEPTVWKVLVPVQPVAMVSEQAPVLEQHAPRVAVQGLTVHEVSAERHTLVAVDSQPLYMVSEQVPLEEQHARS